MPPKKKFKGWTWLYAVIWIFTVVMFAVIIVMQMSGYNDYRRELAQIEEDLAYEDQVREDLMDEMIYNESDAYIEQQAREQLGLIRSDEILIINDAE